jgi:HEPN domain-containing protein
VKRIEWERYRRQAEHTLASARRDLAGGDYDWASFKTHQAAELALKGFIRATREYVTGHSLLKLLASMQEAPADILDCARELDKVSSEPPGQAFRRSASLIPNRTSNFRFAAGRIDVKSGQELRSEVKNVLAEINWDCAAVARLGASGLTTMLPPFSSGKTGLEGGPEHNLLLQPGGTVGVPEDFDRTTFTENLKDWTQILYQFGLGAAAIKVLRE